MATAPILIIAINNFLNKLKCRNTIPALFIIKFSMNKRIPVILIFFVSISYKAKCSNQESSKLFFTDSIPTVFLGNFMDDYGINYSVTDSLWTQHPGIKYHIIKWNTTDQYIIAKNGSKNPSEADLYTRIDYMQFKNMEPFGWGFCLTVYDAKNSTEAETKAKADRLNPKKGCGGYPFSRMKRIN